MSAGRREALRGRARRTRRGWRGCCSPCCWTRGCARAWALPRARPRCASPPTLLPIGAPSDSPARLARPLSCMRRHARCVGWRAVGAPGTAVAHLKCGQSDCAHTAAQYQSLLWPVPRTAKAAELLRVHCHQCRATEYPKVPQSACGVRAPGCPGCSHRQSAVCGDGAPYSRWHVLRADPEGLDLCRPDWRQS